MRGKRVSIAGKKIDLIVVAAHREPGDQYVQYIRGYERRGAVWSDIIHLDRQSLIDRVKSGEAVVTGIAEGQGHFEVTAKVKLSRTNGVWGLVAEGRSGEEENLGLPLI